MVTDVAVVAVALVCRVVTVVLGGMECVEVAAGVSVVRGACVVEWPGGLDVTLEVVGGRRHRRQQCAVNNRLMLTLLLLLLLQLLLLSSNQQVQLAMLSLIHI